MAVVLVVDDALSVMLVLYFHASEAAHVDIGAEVLARTHTLVHFHVQIESSVGLSLAILETSLLSGSLGGGEFRINAVSIILYERGIFELLLALSEKELGEGVSEERLAIVLGVSCPIRHFILISIIKYIIKACFIMLNSNNASLKLYSENQ